jgi:hypothetical protein
MQPKIGSKGPKRRWHVSRVAGRGRSWAPAQRDLVVKARTLRTAIEKALAKADVDLLQGTGVTLVLVLDARHRRHEGAATDSYAQTGKLQDAHE